MKQLDDFLSSLESRLVIEKDTSNEEWEATQRKHDLQQFHDDCGMDKDYFDATIESDLFSESHKKTLADYVQSYNDKKGMFLVILGEVGTGKTYSACAVMNELKCGTYLDMPELKLKLNTADRYGAKENREAYLHRLASCSLLVLDEVGRYEGKRDEELEILFYLMNKRYANRRPTIICSNLTAKGFGEYIGLALKDRLRGRNMKLILEGKSLRGEENE